jgi:hypothetical protein
VPKAARVLAALQRDGWTEIRRRRARMPIMEVIDFALEGDPTEYDNAAQAITLEISLTPAA